MHIINRLNYVLQQQPLADREVAVAVEMDAAHFNRIKNGRVQPNVGTALRLARALGTDVETLFRLPPDPDGPARQDS